MNDATAIIGAGWLGAAIANACQGTVIATTRTGRRPPELADAVVVVPLDLLDRDPDLLALADARTWVLAIAPGPDQDRRAIYIDGPERLLARLPSTHVRRVVWIGSTSALPDIDGVVDETCGVWPDESRGRIQREAEAIVERACTSAGVSWIVLRMGGLYGPGRALDRLSLRDKPLDDGARATNLIHRDDAVVATLAAITHDVSGIVHVVDDDHCARRVMIDAARAAAGLTSAEWAGPAAAPHGKRVDNQRLRAWLGVTLRHPRHSPLAPPDGRA